MAEFWLGIQKSVNPLIVQLGSLQLSWYNLMLLVGALLIYVLVRFDLKRNQEKPLSVKKLDDLLFYILIGMLAGGRFGSFLSIQYDAVFNSSATMLPAGERCPFETFSYYGALSGIVLSSLLFSKLKHLDFFTLADSIIPYIPLGHISTSIGDFLNQTVIGAVTNSNYGVFYLKDASKTLRHPVQLYEAVFGGVALFVFFAASRQIKLCKGKLFAFYLAFFGLIKLGLHFFYEPNATSNQAGLFFAIVMAVAGLSLLVYQFVFTKK